MNTKVCENSGTKNYVPEFVPESYRDVPDSIVNKAQKQSGNTVITTMFPD